MTEALPISSSQSAKSAQSADNSPRWLPLSEAAQLLHQSERHTRRRCGTEWLALGQARLIDGQWQVRSDLLPADPALGTPISRSAPVDSAPNLPPALLRKAAERLAIVQRWRRHLSAGVEMQWSRDQATDHFLRELNLERQKSSVRPVKRSALYEWSAAARRQGISGLVDGRALRRESGLQDKNADPFLTYVRHLYEHENKRTVRWCHDHALLKAQETGWEAASYTAAKRYLQSLNPAELIDRRGGAKAFNDACTPNVTRDYSALRSNEIWTADHHQMDVLVKAGERLNAKTGEMEPFYGRPWLTAWMDCRSRKVVGRRIRFADPATDVIIETWRSACRAHGVPEWAYTDNGKDFLAQTFTGESKAARTKRLFTGRKLHVEHDQIQLGGIYAACHAQHMTAWKYHGQSKPIERFFRTACLRFAVEFETYCGRSPDDRPAGVYAHMGQDGRLEAGLAPDLPELLAAFDTWLECDYHQHFHRGDGMEEFKGGPNEAWETCLVTKRTIDEHTLDVMCNPPILAGPVTADGVMFEGITYGRGQIAAHFGRKVLVRLRETVESISVWTLDDKELIAIADANESVPFHATQEQLKAAIREKRRDTRKLRDSFEPKLRIHETVAERMTRLRNATRTAGILPAAPSASDPYILQPLRSDLEAHSKALQTAEETREAMGGFRQAAGAEISVDAALAIYGGSEDA